MFKRLIPFFSVISAASLPWAPTSFVLVGKFINFFLLVPSLHPSRGLNNCKWVLPSGVPLHKLTHNISVEQLQIVEDGATGSAVLPTHRLRLLFGLEHLALILLTTALRQGLSSLMAFGTYHVLLAPWAFPACDAHSGTVDTIKAEVAKHRRTFVVSINSSVTLR
jgi:hypothetical protein